MWRKITRNRETIQEMKLRKIKKVIELVRELPTLPMVACKVNTLLGNPHSSASDLSAVIEKDQSITAKVLKLVNSALYNLSQRVTNITQAIALLGYKNISYIVMTISVFDTVKSISSKGFDRTGFWIHSIATAIMCRKIAKMSGYKNIDDVFTSGLLHDIGKVFMDGYLHEEFMHVIATALEQGISFYDAEHQLFDIDHTLIGEWISRKWGLPIHIIATVKHHHQKLEQRSGLLLSSDRFIDIVRLADTAVKTRKYGHSGDGKGYKPGFTDDMFVRLPVLKTDIESGLDDLKDELEKSKILLNLTV